MPNFGETLDLDQIEGAEFEFWGPEMKFERNKRSQILKFETKVWSPKSKFRAGQTLSNCQKVILRNFQKLDTDQIEGAEFEFLGPEMRFERNKTKQILKFETKVWSPKSKFGAGQT